MVFRKSTGIPTLRPSFIRKPMGRLEDKRLLIVVDEADYRALLSDVFLPEMLVEHLADRVSAADLHLLNAAAHWGEQIQEIAVFSCYSEDRYSEMSYLGIRLMGSGVERGANIYVRSRDRMSLVADFCPTHIVLCTPEVSVLQWATRNDIPSVVLLSDWQGPLGWRQQWQHNRLIKLLNHDSVKWVGNHGIYACKILESSGIRSQKIIPWEWPQPQFLSEYVLPKEIRDDHEVINLAYAGPMSLRSGISDLVNAVGHIQKRGESRVHLDVIIDDATRSKLTTATTTDVSTSDEARSSSASSTSTPTNTLQGDDRCDLEDYVLQLLQIQAEQLGISHCITFSSALSSEQVVAQMREADLVVIPGCAHDLPVEPPQSLFMAMAARTPIVATSQPHFKKYLSHGVNAMIFPVGNDKSMAHRIERVMGQPQQYAQLSEASEISLSKLKVPARWDELIDHWLTSGVKNEQWLCDCAFSSGRYEPLSQLDSSIQSLRHSA